VWEWALDLYLWTPSRAHADLDIGVLRRDINIVLAALSSWEIFAAKDGALAPSCQRVQNTASTLIVLAIFAISHGPYNLARQSESR
jgi:hypothetical protein